MGTEGGVGVAREVVEKIPANLWSASCCVSDSAAKGDAGDGCRSAWMRSQTAAAAALAEETVSMATCVGNHSMVSAMRSEVMLAHHTR